MKKCNKCETFLDESNFYKDKYKKDGLATICKDCINKYHQENRDIIYAYNRKYCKEHRERGNERQRIRRSKFKEVINEQHREWLRNNPDKVKQYKDKDYADHRNTYVQRAKLRRKRFKELRADLTYEMWLDTLLYFGNKCAYCGAEGELWQEHVIPVVRGGEYIKSNIIPACPQCNLSKHDRELEVWYRKQPFFREERLAFIKDFIHAHANQSGSLEITG